MSLDKDSYDPQRPDAEIETLRKFVGYGAGAQVALWILFAFYYAAQPGTPFELMLATAILVVFIAPALTVSMLGRGRWIIAAGVLAGLGLICNVFLIMNLVRNAAR